MTAGEWSPPEPGVTRVCLVCGLTTVNTDTSEGHRPACRRMRAELEAERAAKLEARELAETYWHDSRHGLCGAPDPIPWKPAPADEDKT